MRLPLVVAITAVFLGSPLSWAEPDKRGSLTFPPIPPAIQHGIHPPMSSPSHCYSPYCCNNKDCVPLASGAVRRTPEGYDVPLPNGERFLIPYGSEKIKQSTVECVGEDFGQRDHACYQMWGAEWQVRCFYPRLGLF